MWKEGCVQLLISLDVEINTAIPALHAVSKGIPVVSPAGNEGPHTSSVVNISPWILTVAVSTLDLSLPTLITLGNNVTLQGQSLYTGPEIAFTEVVSYNDHPMIEETKGKVLLIFESSREGHTLTLPMFRFTVATTSIDRTFYVDMTLGNNITYMGRSIYTNDKEVSAPLVYVEDWKNDKSNLDGKVVLTFVKDDIQTIEAYAVLIGANATGMIVARNSDKQPHFSHSKPAVNVDYELGTKILSYIRSSSSSRGKTLVGRPLASQVCRFSSRGPNSASPAILKLPLAPTPFQWLRDSSYYSNLFTLTGLLLHLNPPL